MDFKQDKIGFVSSGGGVRTFYNLGFLYGLLKHNCNIRRISGASGGIICLLPFFPELHKGYKDIDWDASDYEAKEFIKREMFTVPESFSLFNPLSNLYLSNENIFHVKFNNMASCVIDINENCIKEKYVSKTLWENKDMPDIFISISSLGRDYGIKNRIYHANKGMFTDKDLPEIDVCEDQQDKLHTLLSKVIKATGTLVTLSEPVVNPQKENEHWIDGGYTNNSPMNPMFDETEKKHGKKNPESIDTIIVIDYSNYNAYSQKIQDLKWWEKVTLGLSKLIPQANYEENNISFLLSVFGSNAELIKRSEDINVFVKACNASKKGGSKQNDPVKIGDRFYVYKDIYRIQPGKISKEYLNEQKEIRIETTEEDALANYNLGKKEAEVFAKLKI